MKDPRRFLVPDDVQRPPFRAGWVAVCEGLPKTRRRCLWRVLEFVQADLDDYSVRWIVQRADERLGRAVVAIDHDGAWKSPKVTLVDEKGRAIDIPMDPPEKQGRS